MRTRIARLLLAALLAGGCASTVEGPARQGVVLLEAGDAGAVAVDRTTGTLLGFDRGGTRVWSDASAFGLGATFVCLAECPDAVLSFGYRSAGPDPEPVLVTAAAAPTGPRRPFPVSTAHHRRVLTAVSAGDAIVEETVPGSGTHLRVVRGEVQELIPVPYKDYYLVPSADRRHAIALTRIPDAPGAELLWFERDETGWRAAGRLPRERVWHGCLADGGHLALVTGRDSALIVERERRIPLRTDLQAPGECGIGPHGGMVVQRSTDGSGRQRTAIRGVGPDGGQTWSRDVDDEAFASATPSGRHTAIAHGGRLEILDATGRPVHTQDDVRSARFTASGQLVVVTMDGRVRWTSTGLE